MNLIRRYLSLLTALRSKIIAPKDDVRVRVDAVVRVRRTRRVKGGESEVASEADRGSQRRLPGQT